MASLARLQSSSASNPALDLFVAVNGELSDAYIVEFQIFDKTSSSPVQVYPVTPGDRQAVNLNLTPVGEKLETGHYFAAYTVPSDANLGTFEVRWFFKYTSLSAEQSFYEEFTVVEEMTAGGAAPLLSYATIADMRDEGVPTSVADALLAKRLLLASRFVEAATKRFFYPKAMTITVDGRGGPKVLLDDPIISVSEVLFDTTPWAPSATMIDLDMLRVYNRHLTEGLLSPDDRNNPKIEIFTPAAMLNHYGAARTYTSLVFPRGQRNVTITGVFGYTDPDGTATGKTPDLIVHVTKLLVMRELDKMSKTAARFDRHARHRLTSERTRDQAYTLEGLGTAKGYFTGDPEIDNILAYYQRPPALGAA